MRSPEKSMLIDKSTKIDGAKFKMYKYWGLRIFLCNSKILVEAAKVTMLYIKFILNGYIVDLRVDVIFYYNLLIVED